jgi:hypothetical protein
LLVPSVAGSEFRVKKKKKMKRKRAADKRGWKRGRFRATSSEFGNYNMGHIAFIKTIKKVNVSQRFGGTGKIELRKNYFFKELLNRLLLKVY